VFTNFTLHGAPVEEVVGKHLSDFVPEQYLADVQGAIDTAIRTRKGVYAEGEMIHAGQTEPKIYEVRMQPVLSDDKVSGVVANISDVTELRRQQAHLHLQARIIETIREGVLLLDPAGRILLANPAMHALFGHPEGALAGRNFGELTSLSPAGFDRVIARVLEDLDAGEPAQVELEGVRADGARIAVTCIFAAIVIRNERRIVAVLNDITERKRLEREMLEVANREQQRIGSDLHDGLGQQLTGIALLLRGLASRLARSDGADVAGEVDKVVALVNDAIDSTRSLARGLSPIPAADDGLELALEGLAAQITGRHGVKVAVENELPESVAFDDATSTHLYRIVQEALGNALRHGRPRCASVQLRTEGEQIELAVRDDGCGFDRRAAQEAGLGLKIMRFRAQMIGGDLAVESAPGEGTTIRCHFPAQASLQ
jgi:two-component system sensor kinase FixL